VRTQRSAALSWARCGRAFRARRHGDRGRPRVLASLSTIQWPGQDAVAQRLLDALGGLDVDAVFTTGPALERASLPAPRNVELHHWVDHAELMPEVDLVIGHGGHTTTMRALAHDLPLLMLPMHPMVDQPMVARVVAEHGAGLALPRTASPEVIRQAVDRLLDEPGFTAAAAAIGAQIRARDGAAVAGEYLRAVATTAVPQGR
jgi:UDP:flavonoid glycosyltransferase YjiC (YdhE family)